MRTSPIASRFTSSSKLALALTVASCASPSPPDTSHIDIDAAAGGGAGNDGGRAGDGAGNDGGRAGDGADKTDGTDHGGAGAGNGSGGVTGGVDSPYARPFSDDSPWNTPIAAGAELEPDSANLIADFRSSSQWGEHLDVNIADYSVPLYYADANSPQVTVTCDYGGLGFTGTNGENASASVPWPAGAAPDPESDHHMLIVDTSSHKEYGMWNLVNTSGRWHCGLGATLDLQATGVRPIANGNPTWYTSAGPRACGFGLINGLIRPEEIRAGHIDHALVVAYPHIRAGFYTPPASTGQAANGAGAVSTRGIPCGGRIQFDPTVNLSGLSRSGRIIVEALQKYGAYVGDYSGALSLYADNAPDAKAYWQSGVLDTYELQDAIDLSKLRVLKLGTLYDNGNGN